MSWILNSLPLISLCFILLVIFCYVLCVHAHRGRIFSVSKTRRRRKFEKNVIRFNFWNKNYISSHNKMLGRAMLGTWIFLKRVWKGLISPAYPALSSQFGLSFQYKASSISRSHSVSLFCKCHPGKCSFALHTVWNRQFGQYVPLKKPKQKPGNCNFVRWSEIGK